ncbi:T9SS type A sorting domain-containing protein [Kaistella faecalis]|uniref:T9SS type A sorting domain-containing protein n=1 Tax=Kaistella faecalis TaxID=2852098 RepID=UPI001C458A80|nr:T9SS type A sorting domain-containing protein [Chryseobacterium faecale]UFK96864.1 T9SS type A sorting domain-containing protein [Chryseobacterium faecale]
MKKLSLLFAFFAAVTISAQFTVQTISQGVVKLTYGASNDYSIYDPGFEVPTFYVHVWSNAGDNSTGTVYDDSWTNSNVTMNWDSGAGAYVGTINLNTKVFTNGNKTFPSGTTVNNLGFVFKDLQNGNTKQSADLAATSFGFTTTTTNSSLAVSNSLLGKKSSVMGGKLYTSTKGNLAISVYEMSGKLVKSFNTVADGSVIDLNVSKTGLYLVKISHGSESEVVKFAK